MAQRADAALFGRGIVKSRARAKALILDGKVLLNGKILEKPAVAVDEGDVLELTEDLPFVGRGGLKLAGAFGMFPLEIAGRVCMDIGASTGGFTDCMLQRGAAKVYAIDVGHGQLDPTLAANPAVVNMEGTDFRTVCPEDLQETPDFAGIDVSFISLKLILPGAYRLLADGADCVALIKPQFEVGRAHIGKKGIVRDQKVREQVVRDITAFAQTLGFSCAGLCESPIRGGDGNVEYLAHFVKQAAKGCARRVPGLA